eukprot:TRINITY_DN2977_c0_g1_i2.p1 TRINITY_DN2977_c0_g1~~TRINITY_DN2977_c0_g1_i2.p1  ORF type:complete len:382 (-),score=54.86 TRINITY_DN2977_c0_g1_i2:45-1190(-)
MSIDWCNVLCRQLPAQMTDDELYTLFRPYGEVLSARIMWDSQRNCSKKYGFVRFSTPEQAERAIKELDHKLIQGKPMICTVSNLHDDQDEPPSDNLYIKYLPETVDDAKLFELFSPFGEILQSCVIINLETKNSKRLGFVRYSSLQSAIDARNALNGKAVCDSPYQLLIKFAESPEQKMIRKQRKSKEFQTQSITSTDGSISGCSDHYVQAYPPHVPLIPPNIEQYPVLHHEAIYHLGSPLITYPMSPYCYYHPLYLDYFPPGARYVEDMYDHAFATPIPKMDGRKAIRRPPQQANSKVSENNTEKRKSTDSVERLRNSDNPARHLFVFNLCTEVTHDQLFETFAKYGDLEKVSVSDNLSHTKLTQLKLILNQGRAIRYSG